MNTTTYLSCFYIIMLSKAWWSGGAGEGSLGGLSEWCWRAMGFVVSRSAFSCLDVGREPI